MSTRVSEAAIALQAAASFWLVEVDAPAVPLSLILLSVHLLESLLFSVVIICIFTGGPRLSHIVVKGFIPMSF